MGLSVKLVKKHCAFFFLQFKPDVRQSLNANVGLTSITFPVMFTI